MQMLIVRSRTRTATVRAIVAAACGIFAGLAACNGQDGRGDAPDTAGPPSADRGSPRLTKPVADYTGEQFQSLISALYFGGSSVDSAIAADTSVTAPAPGSAELMIEAMSAANQVDLNDVGNYGTVVARLRNLGGGSDPTFGTTPGATREYYVIVTPDPRPDTAAFAIVGLVRGPRPTVLPRGNTGIIAPCAEDEPPPAYSSARFGGCTHRGSTAVTERRSLFGVRTLWAQGRGSAWVSCTAGCCELTTGATLQQ